MNWNEQVEEMTKVWTENQQKMWQSWYNLAQSAPQTSPFGAVNWLEQWNEIATKGFESWTEQADPTAKATAQRMFDNQKALFQFYEFAAEAWQGMMNQMQAGGDWQSSWAEYTKKLQAQLTQSAEATFKMNADNQELWQQYSGQMQKMLEPWLQAWQNPVDFFSPNGMGRNQALFNLNNLYWNTFDQTFGQFLSSPTLGYTREFEGKLRQSFKAWLDYRRADYNYQLLIIEAWVKSFENLQQKLVTLSEKGDTVDSVAEFATLWTTLAEESFAEIFRTEQFIRTQGKLIEATMNYRIQQRQLVEMVCEMLDIPTRTEVDAAHKANYELRKEVKALKKAMAGQDRSSTDDVKQTIATLQDEVATLKDAVAKLTAKPSRSSARTTSRSTTKKKPAKTAASTKKEGA